MEKNNELPTMTTDELIVCIEQAVRDMHKQLHRQKIKLGPAYNPKNNYARLNERFGEDPRKLLDEYSLIIDKKSMQPAAVRQPIKYIVEYAMDLLIASKAKQQQQQDANSKDNNAPQD
jgi:hypothetical protein